MNLKIKHIFWLFGTPIIIAGVCFLSYLFILPPIMNSGFMIKKYEKILSSKLGMPVSIEGLKFSSHPNLSFDFKIKQIFINENNNHIFEINDGQYISHQLSAKPKKIDIDEVFIDLGRLQTKLKSDKNNSSKFDFTFSSYPMVNINQIYISFDNVDSSAIFENITSKKKDKKIITTFLGKIKTPYTKTPILVGRNGSLLFAKKPEFKNLSIELENSKLNIDGAIDNLNMTGKDLPAGELKETFLYFYKIKHPNKKNFIENFHNLSGKIDLNLNIISGKYYGNCYLKDASALFFDYKIPINLPFTDFKFSNKNITAKTNGLFGSEPVYTDFYLTGLATKDLKLKGSVHSILTNNFSKKYFPIIQIIGNADTLVKYYNHKGNVSVDYILKVNKGSNILSKYGNLDNNDKNRTITVKTLKQGNRLTIKNYEYAINNAQIILFGTGLFEKVKGYFKPSYLTLKTNGRVPFEIIQPYLKNYLNGGTFASDIKYVFTTQTLTGFITLYNIHHKDFLVLDKANILIKNNELNLNSSGTFFNSPINLALTANNKFKDEIFIKNIDIHLKKFIVQRGNIKTLQNDYKQKQKVSTKTHNLPNIKIKSGKILVDEIYNRKFQLYNVGILGNMDNNIVNFIIPQTGYAGGILSAKGKYNVKSHASDINFYASDIDSNEVVTRIFNLPDQVKGSAYATLHLVTKNKLNDILAHAVFAIKDGYLQKLGSKEFILKKDSKFKILNSVKLTLSKITNIDFANHAVLESDITGSFTLHNDCVKDAKIYSQSDYLSLFINGDYNIDTGNTCLCIWGRHNKTAERKIKIFKIPLSFLYKIFFRIERSKNANIETIKQIPPIKIGKGEIESLFRVIVDGDLRSKENLKIEMKDLR